MYSTIQHPATVTEHPFAAEFVEEAGAYLAKAVSVKSGANNADDARGVDVVLGVPDKRIGVSFAGVSPADVPDGLEALYRVSALDLVDHLDDFLVLLARWHPEFFDHAGPTSLPKRTATEMQATDGDWTVFAYPPEDGVTDEVVSNLVVERIVRPALPRIEAARAA